MFIMKGRQLLHRMFRQWGEGWGKNLWIEPLASWDSVQRPAKDQSNGVEIGLSVRGQPAACMVGAVEDQEPQKEKSEHDVLFLSMESTLKKPGQTTKK
jgi:hypothetical protein